MIKELILKIALSAIALGLASDTPDPRAWVSSQEPLREIEQLRKLIVPPVFKDKDYYITDYGAVADGKTKNTTAFKNAIEACSKAGGGRVIVPAGRYFTGPIYLESNVNLHLTANAEILFSQDTKDYPLVLSRWEGMDCMNYSAQFYAYGEQNIAITGSGIINGNGDKQHWWPWKGRKQYGWKEGGPTQQIARDSLHVLMHNKVPAAERIFGDGYYLRPYMFQPYNCKNIVVSGVKMIDSPMWFISPVMCENVIIENVHVASHGPNTDGCDPDACKNVLIRGCYFDTGDDCIAIKSGRDEDGRGYGRPAENHIIENCEMKDGHGGIVIGSEIAGGVKNIYAINCRMSSPELDRVLRIKTSSSRGGIIENVFLKDIKVGTYKDAAITINMFYENPGNHIPVVRNVWVENLSVSDGGDYGVHIRAYKESPVQHLMLVNCNIEGVVTPIDVDYIKHFDLKNTKINGTNVSAPVTNTN